MTPSDSQKGPESTGDRDQDTTVFVRQAIEGNTESVSWVVERFTPLLIAQARYRIGPGLQRILDPEDLVQDTWAVALPKLDSLPSRSGRFTPVVVRFLSTTLLFTFNNQLKKHLNRGKHETPEINASTRPSPLNALPVEMTGVVTQAIRFESVERMNAGIDELSEQDREIIILRGMEQNSLEDIASLLDISRKNAGVRYGRALKKLRALLPDSVFEEFPDS